MTKTSLLIFAAAVAAMLFGYAASAVLSTGTGQVAIALFLFAIMLDVTRRGANAFSHRAFARGHFQNG